MGNNTLELIHEVAAEISRRSGSAKYIPVNDVDGTEMHAEGSSHDGLVVAYTGEGLARRTLIGEIDDNDVAVIVASEKEKSVTFRSEVEPGLGHSQVATYQRRLGL